MKSMMKYLLVDPCEREERVTDGKMVIGMNKHREICMLQVMGQMLLHRDQVARCSNIAVVKVIEMTELVQRALANDKAARQKGEKCGFAESTSKEKINTTESVAAEVDPPSVEMQSDSDSGSEHEMESEDPERSNGESPEIMGRGVGVVGKAAVATWKQEDITMKKELKAERGDHMTRTSSKSTAPSAAVSAATVRSGADGDLGDDSEEETTQVLNKDLEIQPRTQMKNSPVVSQKQSKVQKTPTSGKKKKKR
nr:hypothetical protein BaRGS_002107 [Batillaria attramentaria]